VTGDGLGDAATSSRFQKALEIECREDLPNEPGGGYDLRPLDARLAAS
jgi:hypothetical protein